VQELKAKLPPSAHSLYYVDQIGNVSTSDVRKTSAEVRRLEGLCACACLGTQLESA